MSRHRNFTTAIAVFLLAAPLAAQSASQNAAVQNVVPVTAPAPVAAPGVALERAPSLAPTRANAMVGVRAVERESAPAAVPVPSPALDPVGRNPAMMIVGGAAFIVGAILYGNNHTTGTIVMVGGAALGLFGLWQYLK
jgi:hypothetical protein